MKMKTILFILLISTIVIADTLSYDNGIVKTWLNPDRDSFGIAVKFNPEQHPIQIVGGLGVIHYYGEQNVQLRIYNDAMTMIHNESITTTPGMDSSFSYYPFNETITIESGAFYVCFFQTRQWGMIFANDDSMEYPENQRWYLPDMGWVTPFGGVGDNMVRVVVEYPVATKEPVARNDTLRYYGEYDAVGRKSKGRMTFINGKKRIVLK